MWIDVREALPADDTDVLVYVAADQQCAVARWSGRVWEFADYDPDDRAWYVYDAPLVVTHWQALPAAPARPPLIA
jgi:hypothetical protein